MLDLSIRYCFVEWQGRLIELAGVLALREDEEQLHISLCELDALNQKLREMKSDFRTHAEAVYAEAAQEFAVEFGVEMDESKLKIGSAKRRTAQSKSQAKMVKDIVIHSRRTA
jgi:hypothetical protein